MIDYSRYEVDSRHGDFKQAKRRKDDLRHDGYRVKIRKDANGEHVVYKKHVSLMDVQRGYGNGRNRGRVELPWEGDE